MISSDQESEAEDDAMMSDDYEVENILDKQFSENGLPVYLVKWLGYSEDDNSWEPLSNLSSAKDLVDKFEKSARQRRSARRVETPDINNEVTIEMSNQVDDIIEDDGDYVEDSDTESQLEDEENNKSDTANGDKEEKKTPKSKKGNKLSGAKDLVDATQAGTCESHACTLFIVEGLSALETVKSGLFVLGQDYYGAFALNGKVINVKINSNNINRASNKVYSRLINTLGLNYDRQYNTEKDLKTLRYRQVIIVPDADRNGSNITGCLLNIFDTFWPNLLKLRIIRKLRTPLVTANKEGTTLPFYSLQKFENWVKVTNNVDSYNIQYLKGLGALSTQETFQIFSNLDNHLVTFEHGGPDCDLGFQLFYSPDKAEERRKFIEKAMITQKEDRSFIEHNSSSMTFEEFFNQEYIFYFIQTVIQNIPSSIDGQTQVRRKILSACLTLSADTKLTVKQLASLISVKTDYLHNEISISEAVIKMGQSILSKSNVNFFTPVGQFGQRHNGGETPAADRYISVKISPIAPLVFKQIDNQVLSYPHNYFGTEPEVFGPILPVVLINGVDALAAGFRSIIPNYCPHVLAERILLKLSGKDLPPLLPSYKHFKGTIRPVGSNSFAIFGVASQLSPTSFEITELPINTSTEDFKFNVLDKFVDTGLISSYTEYHTDYSVRFVVQLPENNFQNIVNYEFYATFLLRTVIHTSLVLLDCDNIVKTFGSAEEIFDYFYHYRLNLYADRKRYYEGQLKAEVKMLDNQIRFLNEIMNRTLSLKDVNEKTLIKRNYDSDPVAKWSKQNSNKAEDQHNFSYLEEMPINAAEEENFAKLLNERSEKSKELEHLQQTTKETMWVEDLKIFLAKLKDDEKMEKELREKDLKPEHLPSANGKLIDLDKIDENFKESRGYKFHDNEIKRWNLWKKNQNKVLKNPLPFRRPWDPKKTKEYYNQKRIQYAKDHPEANKKAVAKYRKKNPEKYKKDRHNYYINNREKFIERANRSYAEKKKKSSTSATSSTEPELFSTNSLNVLPISENMDNSSSDNDLFA